MALFLSVPSFAAVESSQANMNYAFNTNAFNTSPASLSSQEMISTEGEWVPLALTAIRFGYMTYRYGSFAIASGRIGSWAYKAAYHGPHHTFRGIGRQPHLQLNTWRNGVSGSGRSWRLPTRYW